MTNFEELRRAQEEEAKLVEVREILVHTDMGSLPNDWTAKMVAEARIDDMLKLRDQVRDTCVRAEKAEAKAERLREALKPMHSLKNWGRNPIKYQKT
jgi:phage-related minor tail protein